MTAATVAVALVAATGGGAAAASAAAAGSGQTVTVDGSSPGRTFDGVGALSAGASSRLLIDYPAQQRSQILDYLFKPDYGASLQILKVEIGGDTNSTDGTEPSHMRAPGQVDCNAGYEWWLMEQAKARNPNIKLYALEWGAPGWVGAGTNTVWTSQNISYILSWLGCARQHGLAVSYLGGWNERGFNSAWFEQLRSALDANGYGGIQLVADDSFSWTVAGAMASDPAFNSAVSIVGQHYPCGYLDAMSDCTSPAVAQNLGKPLWASEQGSQPYDTGAAPLARAINRAYVDGKMTASINWSLIWSAYAGLPFGGDGLMLANTPWSGNYTVGPSIWTVAQTTQFTSPGWRYLDSGSTRIPGGSVVSLRSPSGGDWTSIAETMDATAPEQLTFRVTGGLSQAPVHVWATDLSSTDGSQWFHQLPTVPDRDGTFTVKLQPGSIYTFTTTSGQQKGGAQPPAARNWPLPYAEDFNSYPAGPLPRYFSDLGGSWQTAPCAAAAGSGAGPAMAPSGMCLQQQVTAQPVQWNYLDNAPLTVVGSPTSWTNYLASIDAYLPQAGSVELDGRAQAPGNGVTGYHFRVSSDGTWSVFTQDANGADTTLAQGDAAFAVGKWHQLGLALRGDEITPILDGHPLTTVVDASYSVGQIGLATSPWVQTQFDNLAVVPIPVAGAAPTLAPATPNPVVMGAPGTSPTVSSAVTNPGKLPATAVSATLGVPAGWTATPISAAPATLSPGQSAPVSWQISAPATAAAGTYSATVKATYVEGGLQWVASQPVTIDLGIVPQTAMTATATSAQSGYPASNAIDGNPGTLWHTAWSPTRVYPPQSITLDLGSTYAVTGLRYLPRQDHNINGIITSYQIEVSSDGTNFQPVASGSWALDATEKAASFPAVTARYLRLDGLQGGGGYVSAAEINVVGTAAG